MATPHEGTTNHGRRGGRPAEPRSEPTVPGSNGGARNTVKNGRSPDNKLSRELSRFIGEHPQGWGHEDWLSLLEHLRGTGHDIHDPDAIGALLEQQRLKARLMGVDGIGPRRIEALSGRYGSIWNLVEANAEDVAISARIPQALAERIRSSL